MEKYYLISPEYSVQPRQTKKKGTVYDVYFTYLDEFAQKKQKKLSGFPTVRAAKHGYTVFVDQNCESIINAAEFQKAARVRREKFLAEQRGEIAVVGGGDFTLRIAIDKYLASLRVENKESTIKDKREAYEKFVLPSLGDYFMKDLTKQALRDWQDELLAMENPRTGEPYSRAYILKTRAHLSSLLSWCADKYDTPNEMSKVKVPKQKEARKDIRFWERDEFERFIAEVDDPMYYALFMMLFYTGHRKGEVFALKKEDIVLDGSHPYIRFNKSVTRKTLDKSPYKITDTKTYRNDKVPICKTLADALRGYQFDEPFAFGGENPLAENTVTRKFDHYIKKAGVNRITVHGLRHSFVSMCIHYKITVQVVADLIGDTIQQVLETYAHLWNEAPQAALDEIDARSKPRQT